MDRYDCIGIFQHVIGGIANRNGLDCHLIVSSAIHEHKIFAIFIKELHIAFFQNGYIDFDASIESSIHNFSRENRAQFGTNECWALARLNVLEINNCP